MPYSEQYPGLAAAHSLYEHWLEVTDRGADAADGFLSGLKAKVAEFNTVDLLESRGYSDVQIAGRTTQPVWDITAVSSNGEEVLWQVKTGALETRWRCSSSDAGTTRRCSSLSAPKSTAGLLNTYLVLAPDMLGDISEVP